MSPQSPRLSPLDVTVAIVAGAAIFLIAHARKEAAITSQTRPAPMPSQTPPDAPQAPSATIGVYPAPLPRVMLLCDLWSPEQSDEEEPRYPAGTFGGLFAEYVDGDCSIEIDGRLISLDMAYISILEDDTCDG